MIPVQWESAWLQLGLHVDSWGKAAPVYIRAADLDRHAVVLGTTGSGKSTLLRNLVVQYFGHGGSVVVIEPHGDLLFREDGILAALTPAQREHVTVLDPTDTWVPQLNLATVDWQSGTDVAVQSALSAIRAMEDAGWQDVVRVREILDNTLRVLLNVEGQNASLVHVHKFLVNDKYRSAVLERSNAKTLISNDYWKRRLEQWRKTRYPSLLDVLEPSERRVAGFLRDSHFRHALALPPLVPEMNIHLDTLLNAPDPHLVAVPLLTTKLGAIGKRTFGTLLLQMLTNLFLRRPLEARRPTLILIDEFPDFAGAELGDLVRVLLAQGRKFGASLMLAAQSLAQLPQAVKTEIQINTSTKIILKTEGVEDAAIGAASLGSPDLEAGHFTDMGQYHGYARTILHGQTRPAFYFQALPPQPYIPLVQPRHRAKMVEVPLGDSVATNVLITFYRHVWHAREDVIQVLTEMTEAKFLAVVQAQRALSLSWLRGLQDDPARIPDPIQRLLEMNRYRHAFPAWLLEAYFRRLVDTEQLAALAQANTATDDPTEMPARDPMRVAE